MQLSIDNTRVVPETTRLSSPPLFVNALTHTFLVCALFCFSQRLVAGPVVPDITDTAAAVTTPARCNKNVFFVAPRTSPITVCYYRARFVGLRVLDFSILIKIVKM